MAIFKLTIYYTTFITLPFITLNSAWPINLWIFGNTGKSLFKNFMGYIKKKQLLAYGFHSVCCVFYKTELCIHSWS